MRTLYAALLALSVTGCAPCLQTFAPPRVDAGESSNARDTYDARAEEDGRRAELEARARALPVLDTSPRPYRILGFISADAPVGESSQAILDLQIQALSMGASAVLGVAHEIETTGTTTQARGHGIASPLFGNAVVHTKRTETTTVTNVEHWTAKVILFEVASVTPQSPQ